MPMPQFIGDPASEFLFPVMKHSGDDAQSRLHAHFIEEKVKLRACFFGSFTDRADVIFIRIESL